MSSSQHAMPSGQAAGASQQELECERRQQLGIDISLDEFNRHYDRLAEVVGAMKAPSQVTQALMQNMYEAVRQFADCNQNAWGHLTNVHPEWADNVSKKRASLVVSRITENMKGMVEAVKESDETSLTGHVELAEQDVADLLASIRKALPEGAAAAARPGVWMQHAELLTLSGPKTGGTAIGAMYKDGGGALWIGKAGDPLEADAKASRLTKCRVGTNLNAVKEKVASDGYWFLSRSESIVSPSYFVPEVKLAILPLLNEHTRNNVVAEALYETLMIESKRPEATRGNLVHLMSKFIVGFVPMKDLSTREGGTAETKLEDFVEREHRLPETVVHDGQEYPFKGAMEVLAASRLLADTDVLHGRFENAGVVISQREARAVKIDTGYGFNYDGAENKLFQSFNRMAKPGSKLADQKDIQYGHGDGSSVLRWDRLTAGQRCGFLRFLFRGIAMLRDKAVLGRWLDRSAYNAQGEDHVRGGDVDQLMDQIAANLEVQEEIYRGEIIDEEVVREVERIQVQTVEKIVEVPQVQYVERIVEVPQIQVQEVVKEVPVPVTTCVAPPIIAVPPPIISTEVMAPITTAVRAPVRGSGPASFSEVNPGSLRRWLIMAAAHWVSQIKEIREDAARVEQIFEEQWAKSVETLSGGANMSEVQWTYQENLSKTFRGVNKLMREISAQEFEKILVHTKSEVVDGLPVKLRAYLAQMLESGYLAESESKSQFRLDQQMLTTMNEDPECRIFAETDGNFTEKYLRLKDMLLVDFEYRVVHDIHDMSRALNTPALEQRLNGFLFHSKERIVTRERRTGYSGKHYYWGEVARDVDDMAKIRNSVTLLLQDLGQAGFCYVQDSGRVQPLGEYDFELASANMADNDGAKLRWLEDFFQAKYDWLQGFVSKIQFRAEHYKNVVPRVEGLLQTERVQIPDQPHPTIPVDVHRAVHPELGRAQIIVGAPNKHYKFSMQDGAASGKIDVHQLLRRPRAHIKEAYLKAEQYRKSMTTTQSYEMAHDKKWTYLAELANMRTDWDAIVEDIHKAVQSLNLVSDEEAFGDEGHLTEDSFDLQKILDLNQVSIDQGQEIETVHLNAIRAQLEKEVHNKLALVINPQLHGDMTWVACVICWYKLQNKVVTKLHETLARFTAQRETWKQNFLQIVAGQSSVATATSAA